MVSKPEETKFNLIMYQGEWTTPKELQGLQCKPCTSCGEDVDTNYLVPPNESKRRSKFVGRETQLKSDAWTFSDEDLLRKIRERKSASTRLMTTLV